MTEEKLYLLNKVITTNIKEFSEVWRTNNLPVWIREGVIHVGSWRWLTNGTNNEIVRLFEFKNFVHYTGWINLRDNTPEGLTRVTLSNPYILNLRQFMMRAAPYFTPQYFPLSEGKLYQMVTVTTNNRKDYSQEWTKYELPFLEKNGVGYIGSWTWLMGGPNNEIIRFFEFRDYAHLSDWLSRSGDSQEEKDRIRRINSYIIKTETNLLKKVPY